MSASPRIRTWRNRTLAALAGLLLPFALLEAGLRIANEIKVREVRARRGDLAADGRPLVAFAGDSHIYGVYVEERNTLSRSVERYVLSKAPPGIRTVNFGVPGAPSWVILDQVDEALALRPRAVVVRAGFNNLMQVPPGDGIPFLDSLRIAKAWRILAFNWRARDRSAKKSDPMALGTRGAAIQGEQVKVDPTKSLATIVDREGNPQMYEIVWEGKTLQFDAIAPRLRRDLEAMAERGAKAGIPIVFTTYLLGEAEAPFVELRAHLLDFARARGGVTVADCAPELFRAVRTSSRPATSHVSLEWTAFVRGSLLYNDTHPTPLGYDLEARVVASALEKCGAIPKIRAEDPVSVLWSAKLSLPRLKQIAGAAGELRFSAEGAGEGARFSLFVGKLGRGTGRGVSLPVDPTGFTPGGFQGYVGTTTPTGRSVVSVPAADASRWKGPAHAVAIVEKGDGGWTQTMMSEVVEVDLGGH